jgi:serine/threonine protein phosphatase 1
MAASQITEAVGKRIFVFGDIHGCADETAILTRFIEEKEGLAQDDLLIFLGDYIDRGPNSRAVIDLMIELKLKFPNTRFLKGNHEDMLLDFLGFGGRLGQAFLYNGGLETIQSYGISVFSPPDEMVKNFPEGHFKFITTLESIIQIENFICVHAGLNPLRAMNSQNDGDVCWIRDEFIGSPHNFNKIVVFGHTPHQDVFLHLPYKIGLDTGLVFGNKLTCLELRSGDVFQIAKNTEEVTKNKVSLAS